MLGWFEDSFVWLWLWLWSLSDVGLEVCLVIEVEYVALGSLL